MNCIVMCCYCSRAITNSKKLFQFFRINIFCYVVELRLKFLEFKVGSNIKHIFIISITTLYSQYILRVTIHNTKNIAIYISIIHTFCLNSLDISLPSLSRYFKTGLLKSNPLPNRQYVAYAYSLVV